MARVTWTIRNRNRLGRWFVLAIMPTVFLGGCARLRATKENAIYSRQLTHQALEAVDQHQWEQARQLFDDAVETCPNDDRVRHEYAKALWAQGEYTTATAEMEQAVALSGNAPDLLVTLGQMYLEQGRLPDAARTARQAIQRDRHLAASHALMGHIHSQQGDRDAALASHLHALSLQAEYPEVELAVAEIYQQTSRSQRALAILQSLESRYPRDQVPARVLVTKGLALKTVNRFDESAKALAEASRYSSNPDLMYHLAESRLLAGDFGNARLAVERALEVSPNHSGCKNLLAQIEQNANSTAAIRR